MIHVLTLNWNGLDKLSRLKAGLIKNLNQTDQKWAWYIRDNGSTDGSVEWLDAINGKTPEGNKIEVIKMGHNRDNFAEGVNSLFEAAEPSQKDFILLLNNDVEFGDSQSLLKMIKIMDDPNVGIVGARLLYPGTNMLQHAGVIFSNRYGKMPYHYRHKEESDSFSKKNRYFQAVTAACCLIRAEAFQKLDTKFHWSFEDIDLNLRIGKDGWKIVYCGETEIYHEESASLKKNPVNRMFLSHNVTYFKKKWFGKYEIDHDKYLKDPAYNKVK